MAQKIVKRKDGSIDVQEVDFEPTLTQQQYKDDADINVIMARHNGNADRALMFETKKQGFYADVSGMTDYKEMVEAIKFADETFMTLPAEIRKRFDNNPGNFINFLDDDKNYDEAVKLGFMDEEKVAKNRKKSDPPADPPAGKPA